MFTGVWLYFFFIQRHLFFFQIVSERHRHNHLVNDYFLSLSFPVSLLLRQRALCIALKDLLPEIYQSDVLEQLVTVKEAWRWANLPSLTTALQLQHNTDSHFHVNLSFSHAQAQHECRFLYGTNAKQFSRRKNANNSFNLSNVKLALNKLSDDEFRAWVNTYTTRDVKSFFHTLLFHSNFYQVTLCTLVHTFLHATPQYDVTCVV